MSLAACGQLKGRAAARSPFRPPLQRLAAALVLAVGVVLLALGGWIHAKALAAQILLDRAFEESERTGRPVKPWAWADTWPVARVELPRLHRSAVVLAGASGQALAFGPGQVRGTPKAGDPGLAIYAAHRDTHFAFLGEVRVGDVIEVRRADGVRVAFRVTGASVVRWNASGLDPQAAGRGLALVTCWPLGAQAHGPLRYVVRAERAG